MKKVPILAGGLLGIFMVGVIALPSNAQFAPKPDPVENSCKETEHPSIGNPKPEDRGSGR